MRRRHADAIAAAGLGSALAAANGLDPAAARGHHLTSRAAAAAPRGGAAPRQGAYTVRPGDTLSGLAAGAGVSVTAMAAMNGLDPAGVLLAGTVLKLPTGAPAPAALAEPRPGDRSSPPRRPSPTPARLERRRRPERGLAVRRLPLARRGDRLAGERVQQRDGVRRQRARRDAGDAGHVGLRAAEPRRQRQLDPNSATDNVHAGVLYLKRLLERDRRRRERRDRRLLPGPASVRDRGMYDDTKQYVANVQALRSRFGGSARDRLGRAQPRPSLATSWCSTSSSRSTRKSSSSG